MIDMTITIVDEEINLKELNLHREEVYCDLLRHFAIIYIEKCANEDQLNELRFLAERKLFRNWWPIEETRR